MDRNRLRSILLLLFALPSLAAFSQYDSLAYFFDKDLAPCERSRAAYVGFGVKQNGLIHFTNYTHPGGLPVMEGDFTDSTLAVKDGHFIYYDASGNEESSGRYAANVKQGYWITQRNGRITDSAFYQKGNELLTVSLTYHSSGRLATRLVINNQQDKKEFTHWYEDGTPQSMSVWVGGTGDRTNYNEDGTVYSIDTYEKGRIVSSRYYRKDGTEMDAKEVKQVQKQAAGGLRQKMDQMKAKAEETQPSFPGGSAGLRSFFEKNLQFPQSFLNQVQPGETITISFSLKETGYPYDVKVLNFENFDLQRAVTLVVEKMPKWNMKGHKNFGPINYTLTIHR